MHLLNKRVGETPLELLKRTFPNQDHHRYTYAGRLDPMASGLMLILEDDEVYSKDQYLHLDKTYELDILFGLSTDTYDTLGLFTDQNLTPTLTPDRIKDALPHSPHSFPQPYPPYSSKVVNSQPLWWWAKENRLGEINIPQKEVTLYSLTLNSFKTIPLTELVPQVITNIKDVRGDFRQQIILDSWQHLLNSHPDISLPVANLTISCSSGTYMRSLAHSLGQSLHTPALALSIHRTKLGDYSIQR